MQHWDKEKESYYFKLFPEFTIEIERDEDDCSSEPYALVQQDVSMKKTYYMLKYHATTLGLHCVLRLDGGRGDLVCPSKEYFPKNSIDSDLIYRYEIINSTENILTDWIKNKANSEYEYVMLRAKKTIIFFESDAQKIEFDKYLQDSLCLWRKQIDKYNIDKAYFCLNVPQNFVKSAVLNNLYIHLAAVDVFNQWRKEEKS